MVTKERSISLAPDFRLVTGGCYQPQVPSELYVRLSPHTAQALIRHNEASGKEKLPSRYEAVDLLNVHKAVSDISITVIHTL